MLDKLNHQILNAKNIMPGQPSKPKRNTSLANQRSASSAQMKSSVQDANSNQRYSTNALPPGGKTAQGLDEEAGAGGGSGRKRRQDRLGKPEAGGPASTSSQTKGFKFEILDNPNFQDSPSSQADKRAAQPKNNTDLGSSNSYQHPRNF